MLVSKRTFKLVILNEGDDDYRPATDTHNIKVMGRDDVLLEKLNHSLYTPITSLAETKQIFSAQRTVSILFGVALWAFTLYLTVTTATDIMLFNASWMHTLPLALAVSCTLLYTPRIIHPIARDLEGHWIDLVTGDTNLNGGCVIQ